MISHDSKANENSSKAAANQLFGKRGISLLSPDYKSQIQPKLTINEPGDIYEQEADAMADKVVQGLDESSSIKSTTKLGVENTMLQTKSTASEEEEKLKMEEEDEQLVDEELQMKSISGGISAPPPDEKNIQHQFISSYQGERLQTKSDALSGKVASPAIENSLISSRGSGSPLPPETREQMESSFGADFSNVYIHDDSSAVQMSRDLNAHAFTHGNDIYFNENKYNFNDAEGKRLLAHELTHVVQQGLASPKTQFKPETKVHEQQISLNPVTHSTTIQRQTVVSEVKIEPQPLSESISEEQNARVQDKNQKYTWGSASLQTIDEKGNVVENDANPVVANAKKRGVIDLLRGISRELDIVKPALMAWQSADAAINAIQENTGIDPNKPGNYKNEFKELNRGMSNTKDPVIKEIKDRLNAARQSKIKQAAIKVKEALADVEAATAQVRSRKNQLEQAKLKLDLEKNAADLAKINGAIQNCVTAITTMGKVAAAIAGGVGALESMGASSISLASEADLAAAETGKGAINVAMDPYLPKAVGTAGKEVAGSGDLLTKFFELTLFKADLDKCKAEAASINTAIGDLKGKAQGLETLSIEEKFNSALAKLEGAKVDASEAQESFMTNLLSAGRAWDQRNKSKEEIDKGPQSALPATKGGTSMEGLMGMFAAMTQRGTARESFKNVADRCPHIQPKVAEKIVGASLDSGKASANSEDPIGSTVPIDNPQVSSGPERILTGMIADDLRNGVAFVAQHIDYYAKNAAKEASLEGAWSNAIKDATQKNI